ncbi:hypothetical protein M493_00020 (plasmid) [Geobacillus genomosp. 3]|uniref:Dihydrodiol dehydrogenase n=1 Tax=Geobacillus genomosp. 3 TaxID=1921421 RepID=S5ZTG1_GEOG3|nr:hypothetical protein [Geobacillus genomosp. 3]AGT33883.1 hypothetical protein M493_00020 [Geobacillus genomosp. 3]
MGSHGKVNEITLSNEFATVSIRKVNTRNGARLEIRSPKLGYHILLDPIELESLTWQKKEVISRFLETPFGPKIMR